MIYTVYHLHLQESVIMTRWENTRRLNRPSDPIDLFIKFMLYHYAKIFLQDARYPFGFYP